MKYNPDLYGFKFGTGDINYLDYGAIWYRVFEADPPIYHFIWLTNWEDACGSNAPKETYNMSLSEVNLGEITEDHLNSAFQYQGKDDWRTDPHVNDLWKAEVCLEYGLHAPLRDMNTSNFHKTFRELARYSRELSTDYQAHEAAMERPVNKIGSTASECMRGDLDSALFRGLAEGRQDAKIIAKMQGYQLK